jgi:hypothetical protein
MQAVDRAHGVGPSGECRSHLYSQSCIHQAEHANIEEHVMQRQPLRLMQMRGLAKRLLASRPADDGEACSFGEYSRGGVEIRQPGGQSGRR